MATKADLESRISQLEAELKQKGAARPVFAQSFLTALPIILTVGLGFLANYIQSGVQHQEEIKALRLKGEQELTVQAEQTRRAQDLQRREIDGRLEQQSREFEANAGSAERRFQQEQATLRSQHAAQQAQQAREFAQSNERQRRQSESDLLLQVIRVGDLNVARANIGFLLRAGLVRDAGGRIAAATRDGAPVLPTASGELVSLPSAQSEAGRQFVDAVASNVQRANPRAGNIAPALSQLIDAINRERPNNRFHELAMMLAVIEYETAATFAPSIERCTPSLVRRVGGGNPPPDMSDAQCFELLYGPGTRLGRRVGNREPGDGYRYRGRGYFQIVGRNRYQEAGQQWGVDFLAQPDLVLEPINAFRVAMTYFDRGLQAIRRQPELANDSPNYPYVAAVRILLRQVTGGPVGLERITERSRVFDLLLRERLGATGNGR